MSDYKDWLGLDQFHTYEETEELVPNPAYTPPVVLIAQKIAEVIAEPQVAEVIAEPQVAEVIAEPQVVAMMTEPVMVEAVTNAQVVETMATAAVELFPSKLTMLPPFSEQSKKVDAIEEKKAPRRSKTKEVMAFLAPILIAFLFAIGLRAFVFTNTRVPTPSMEPTISVGSRLVGSKLSYAFDSPNRYDIAIFKYPDDETQMFVKRVIGLPGEKVQIKDGKVYINNNKVPLKDDFVTASAITGDFGPYTVPNGCYFMMGDNRENSLDSRFWNHKFVEENKISAKVKYEYYPQIREIK